MAEIVNLKLIRRQQLQPVIYLDGMSAVEEEGELVWSASEAQVWTGAAGDLDARRFDEQIAEKFCRMAGNWTKNKKAEKHIKRALKALRR